MSSDVIRRAAQHWDEVARRTTPFRLRWWQVPRVLEHINSIICGTRLPGLVGGDIHRLRLLHPGERFVRGVSIGCGSGQKEITLLKQGLVEVFDLYEVSPERVRLGREAAEAAGLHDRIRYHETALDFRSDPGTSYDLVYWNNALHHMLDTQAAIEWSRNVLSPGLIFYMNDYVGANRMQFPDDMLRVASDARRLLPERLLADPRNPGRQLPKEVEPPRLESMIASDPTECVDSEAILPSIRKLFPDAEVRLTGGTIYHLALNDLIHNFSEDDAPLLDALLLSDRVCADAGMTHYAVAVARKPTTQKLMYRLVDSLLSYRRVVYRKLKLGLGL